MGTAVVSWFLPETSCSCAPEPNVLVDDDMNIGRVRRSCTGGSAGDRRSLTGRALRPAGCFGRGVAGWKTRALGRPVALCGAAMVGRTRT